MKTLCLLIAFLTYLVGQVFPSVAHVTSLIQAKRYYDDKIVCDNEVTL